MSSCKKRVSFGIATTKCFSPGKEICRPLDDTEIQAEIDNLLQLDARIASIVLDKQNLEKHRKDFERLEEVMKENLGLYVNPLTEEETL